MERRRHSSADMIRIASAECALIARTTASGDQRALDRERRHLPERVDAGIVRPPGDGHRAPSTRAAHPRAA
jgi:hypothetical protein